jgi:two-component system, OmpR family, response regulator MprA
LLRTAAGRLRLFLVGGSEGWTRPGPDGRVLRFADVTLELRTRIVRRHGRELELTPTEFDLLALFLRHPGDVLTRTEIFNAVWGFDFGASSNSLNVYVGYLRRKLEADGEARILHTVRGIGYVLRP